MDKLECPNCKADLLEKNTIRQNANQVLLYSWIGDNTFDQDYVANMEYDSSYYCANCNYCLDETLDPLIENEKINMQI